MVTNLTKTSSATIKRNRDYALRHRVGDEPAAPGAHFRPPRGAARRSATRARTVPTRGRARRVPELAFGASSTARHAPVPSHARAGRRAPRTPRQEHVTEVSRDAVSAGPRPCPPGRGVGSGAGARARRAPGAEGLGAGGGPGPRRAAGAPGPRGGAGRRAACYLFLLLAEPRHLRGAQRRRGRGRGRGVGPGAGRGLHGGGARTSAGRTSPKQVFVEAARPAAAQRPRARPHARRAPR